MKTISIVEIASITELPYKTIDNFVRNHGMKITRNKGDRASVSMKELLLIALGETGASRKALLLRRAKALALKAEAELAEFQSRSKVQETE